MKTKVQLYTSEKAKQYRLDADMSLRYLGDCLNVSPKENEAQKLKVKSDIKRI